MEIIKEIKCGDGVTRTETDYIKWLVEKEVKRQNLNNAFATLIDIFESDPFIIPLYEKQLSELLRMKDKHYDKINCKDWVEGLV